MRLKLTPTFASLLLATSSWVQASPNTINTTPPCDPVDHATLLSHLQPNEHVRIGPSGFYIRNPLSCFILLVSDPNFETQHPKLYTTHSHVMAAIEAERQQVLSRQALTGRDELEADATPGCGQACDGDCLWPCTCLFAYNFDDGDTVFAVYTCQ